MSHESKWWSMHSPQLVQQDIINHETSGRIAGYFNRLKSRTPIELILISCGLLATLCISGGVISIFAHNWDSYSKGIRVTLGFVPVILGLAVFARAIFLHAESKVWMECASVFLMLMMGSSIALITQVYQMGGTFEKYLLYWMLATVPIIYLANSSLTAILYGAGVTLWAYMKFVSSFNLFYMGAFKDPSIMGYWILIALLIPHFIMNVKPGVQSLRSATLGWFLGYFLVQGASISFLMHQTISISVVIILLYALGKYYYANGPYFWWRPFQTIAILMLLFMAISFTYEFYLRTVIEFNHYSTHEVSEYERMFRREETVREGYSTLVILMSYVLLLGLMAATSLLVFKNYIRRNEINLGIVVFPVVVIFGLLFCYYLKTDLEYATWWFNAYVLFLGGYYLYKGVKMNIGALVAMGIFILSLMVILRYFDSELGFWTKGIVYLLIGAAFLFFNYYFDQKTSETDQENLDA